MTVENPKYYKDVSVKAYAKLINKSDKTVYKMIKDGLLGANKKAKGYEIRVDSFMLNRCEDINKNMHNMKELIESFELRLKEVEQKLEKKKKNPIQKKKMKPLLKTIKKSPMKKISTKPINKSGKSNGKKK